MSKLIVLSGVSGCGKSTYAKSIMDAMAQTDDPNVVIVSSDQMREHLYGDAGAQIDHARVFAEVDASVEKYLSWNDHVVIVDATNLKPRDRASYVEAAQRHGVPCELHIILANEEDCHKGQETRERKVPGPVVERMWHAQQRDIERGLYEFLLEGFDSIKFIKR